MIFGVRVLLAAVVVVFALAVADEPARARDEAVDLQLVLAVDVSWSMDPEEQALQREGYVQAFRDPEIHRAIASGAHRRIAVTYIEWAGSQSQFVVVPWTIIGSPSEALDFASELEVQPISRHRMTSISAALEFAGRQFEVAGHLATRRVIDISGDGPNNVGPLVTHVRDRLVEAGIVINGLPVILKPGSSSSLFDIPHLEDYYAACVVGGPGAFTIAIKERSEFASATRQKLLLEISDSRPLPLAGIVPIQFTAPRNIDCAIGEHLWQRYMDR